MSVILLIYGLISAWSFIVQAARWSHQKEVPLRGKWIQFGLIIFCLCCAISALMALVGQLEASASAIVMCGLLWFLRKKHIFDVKKNNSK